MYLSHFTDRSVVLVLLTIVSLWACKTTHSKEQNLDSVKKIALDKLGGEIESFPNSTGTYILYIQSPNSITPTNILKFIIIEVGTNKIVTEQNFVPGYIKWSTEFLLELLSVPGTLRETESLSDYIKIIDVRSIKP
jgi:hypothetical protein